MLTSYLPYNKVVLLRQLQLAFIYSQTDNLNIRGKIITMPNFKMNHKGFGIIESMFGLVIVVLLSVIGVVIYNNHHKTITTKTNTAVATTQKNSSSSSSPTNSNPYQGWLQYCDTQEKLCFKYPSTWTQSQHLTALSSTLNNVSSIVQSPDQIVNISYNYPYVRDAAKTNFLTMAIDNVPNFPSLKIVGGIYTDTNNFAQYSIVDATDVSQAGLVIGQTSQFINTPRFGFTSDTTNEPYQFVAIDGQSSSNNSLAIAKAWFSSPEATDGVLVLKSMSNQ